MDEAPATTEPSEFCPWCRQTKPVSEWYGPPDDPEGWDPREGPVVCADCRENGPPDQAAIIAAMPKTHRKVLKALAGGASLHEAARAAGIALSSPGNMLRNRGKAPGGGGLREAFQMLLEAEGLNVSSMAREMRLLMYATKPQWNPETKEWDYFPDNSVRLGLLRHWTKIAQLDPPKDPGAGPSTVNVIFETNLDGPPADAPGSYVIDSRAIPETEPPQLEESHGG